jgi:hypothetical protein
MGIFNITFRKFGPFPSSGVRREGSYSLFFSVDPDEENVSGFRNAVYLNALHTMDNIQQYCGI